MIDEDEILVGNSFPFSLIRGHKVVCEEIPMSELREAAKRGIVSFWGHENTIVDAENCIGAKLKPARSRPCIKLDEESFPSLYDKRYKTVYLLSPDYSDGLRPTIGEEVSSNRITKWHALRLEWR